MTDRRFYVAAVTADGTRRPVYGVAQPLNEQSAMQFARLSADNVAGDNGAPSYVVCEHPIKEA
jgi:hypothetical protein